MSAPRRSEDPNRSTASPLDQLRIASPCNADWSAMRGDERSRHCEQCEMSVFHLSSMRRKEAEQLLSEQAGRLCVRVTLDAEGMVKTADPPAVRRRGWFARAASWLTLLVGGSLGVACNDSKALRIVDPPETQPSDPVETMGEAVLMGDVEVMGSPMPLPLMGEVTLPEDGTTTPSEDAAVPTVVETPQEIMGRVAPHQNRPEIDPPPQRK